MKIIGSFLLVVLLMIAMTACTALRREAMALTERTSHRAMHAVQTVRQI